MNLILRRREGGRGKDFQPRSWSFSVLPIVRVHSGATLSTSWWLISYTLPAPLSHILHGSDKLPVECFHSISLDSSSENLAFYLTLIPSFSSASLSVRHSFHSHPLSFSFPRSFFLLCFLFQYFCFHKAFPFPAPSLPSNDNICSQNAFYHIERNVLSSR